MKRPNFVHPSKKALRGWLFDPEGDPALDDHLATCVKCSDTLEVLELVEADAGIADALALVLTSPTGLAERLEEKVVARLSSGEVLGVLGDLFGAGLETSVLLLTEGESDEQG
jgi:hypothetical protein